MQGSYITIKSSKTLDNAIGLLKMGCLIKQLDTSGEKFSYGLNHQVLHLRADPLVLVIAQCALTRNKIRCHLGLDFRLAEAANQMDAQQLAKHLNPALILIAESTLSDKFSLSSLEHIRRAGIAPAPVLVLSNASLDSMVIADSASPKHSQITPSAQGELSVANVDTKMRASNSLSIKPLARGLSLREKVFLQELNQLMINNIGREQVHVSELASALNMSMRTLSRKTKTLLGKTPKQILLSLRLEFAANLLTSKPISITEISYSVGFQDASYFSRKFKAYFKQTPKEFRGSQGLTEILDNAALPNLHAT